MRLTAEVCFCRNTEDFMEQPTRYKRVLLKLSGEALAAGSDGILNFDFIQSIAKVLRKCVDAGVQIGVIVGAGNIWRGRQGGKMDRVRADSMGMLATTINALGILEALEQHPAEQYIHGITGEALAELLAP